MVVIRLARTGTKKRPFYHIAVADKRAPRDGRFIEHIGFYNPIAAGQAERVRLDLERADYWIGVGAQPTQKVASIIKNVREEQPETATANDVDNAEQQPPEVVAEAESAETAEESESTESSTTVDASERAADQETSTEESGSPVSDE